jgi:hypothetical protein
MRTIFMPSKLKNELQGYNMKLNLCTLLKKVGIFEYNQL